METPITPPFKVGDRVCWSCTLEVEAGGGRVVYEVTKIIKTSRKIRIRRISDGWLSPDSWEWANFEPAPDQPVPATTTVTPASPGPEPVGVPVSIPTRGLWA